MARDTSFRRWAERADFGHPLRWGAVERRVVKRRVPRVAIDSLPAEVVFAVAQLLLVIIVIPLLLAPAIGLGAALIARGAEADSAPRWIDVATFALLVAAFLGLAGVIGFVQDRMSSFVELVGAGVSAGICVVSFLVLRDVDVAGAEGAVKYALAGSATYFVSFVLYALGRPALRWPSTRRDRNLPKYKYMYPRYEEARATVLAIIERRGLVHLDPRQREALLQAPLGTWHTFDPEPSASSTAGKRRR